eukprot:1813065-Rhodomonas_salina.3
MTSHGTFSPDPSTTPSASTLLTEPLVAVISPLSTICVNSALCSCAKSRAIRAQRLETNNSGSARWRSTLRGWKEIRVAGETDLRDVVEVGDEVMLGLEVAVVLALDREDGAEEREDAVHHRRQQRVRELGTAGCVGPRALVGPDKSLPEPAHEDPFRRDQAEDRLRKEGGRGWGG